MNHFELRNDVLHCEDVPLPRSRGTVPRLCRGPCSKGLEDLAFLIHCPPQVVHLAIDLHVHLIEAPPPLPFPVAAGHFS